MVTFFGARAGEAPLTWGQRSVWRWIRWLGAEQTTLNVPYVFPIPAGTRLDAVTAALRVLVERHEALRTVYSEHSGGPRQRVLRAGTLSVRLHEGGDAADLSETLAGTPFQHGEELPVRCTVRTEDGRPTALALAVSHLSADWSAMRLLLDEWADLLAGVSPAPPAWQPLDQARAEGAGPVAERGAAALEHWRSALSRLPRSLFDLPGNPPEPDRYVRVGLDSPAVAAATELLAPRWGVSTTTVLATASVAVLTALTGHDSAAVRLIAGNRRDQPLRGMVGKTAQDALLAFDLDGATVGDVARLCHGRARDAYRHGLYDPAALDLLKRRIRHERGSPLDLLVFFNDIRMGQPWSKLPADALDRPARVFVDFTAATAHAKAFFTVEYAADTCLLFVLADTAYLPVAAAERVLRGVQALLLACVAGEVATADLAAAANIEPVRRPAGWLRFGPDWCDPDAVRATLCAACPPAETALTVDAEAGGLVARLTGGAPPDPALVHAAFLRAATGRTDLLAPIRYAVRTAAGTAEGDGRSASRLPDTGWDGP